MMKSLKPFLLFILLVTTKVFGFLHFKLVRHCTGSFHRRSSSLKDDLSYSEVKVGSYKILAVEEQDSSEAISSLDKDADVIRLQDVQNGWGNG